MSVCPSVGPSVRWPLVRPSVRPYVMLSLFGLLGATYGRVSGLVSMYGMALGSASAREKIEIEREMPNPSRPHSPETLGVAMLSFLETGKSLKSHGRVLIKNKTFGSSGQLNVTLSLTP